MTPTKKKIPSFPASHQLTQALPNQAYSSDLLLFAKENCVYSTLLPPS